jgi:hypothetical protein
VARIRAACTGGSGWGSLAFQGFSRARASRRPGREGWGGQQGQLRIIAAITEISVIQNILRQVKLAVDPPLIAPARQAALAWDGSSP